MAYTLHAEVMINMKYPFEQKFKKNQRKDKFAPSGDDFLSLTLEKTRSQYQKRTKLRHKALKLFDTFIQKI